MKKIQDRIIQKLQFLNFNFAGAIGETQTDTIKIDNDYDKIVGIALKSELYGEACTIEEFSFNTRNEMFPKGIMAQNIQFFDGGYFPVEIMDMENKTVTLTLKNYLAASPRKVQVTLILEKK